MAIGCRQHLCHWSASGSLHRSGVTLWRYVTRNHTTAVRPAWQRHPRRRAKCGVAERRHRRRPRGRSHFSRWPLVDLAPAGSALVGLSLSGRPPADFAPMGPADTRVPRLLARRVVPLAPAPPPTPAPAPAPSPQAPVPAPAPAPSPVPAARVPHIFTRRVVAPAPAPPPAPGANTRSHAADASTTTRPHAITSAGGCVTHGAHRRTTRTIIRTDAGTGPSTGAFTGTTILVI